MWIASFQRLAENQNAMQDPMQKPIHHDLPDGHVPRICDTLNPIRSNAP